MAETFPIGRQLASLFRDGASDFVWLTRVASPIRSITIDDEGNGALRIALESGDVLRLRNCESTCCERRYMHSDDNLKSFLGARLASIEMDSATQRDGEYGDVIEQSFIKVRTTNGDFTVIAYNEHNGYYGGINLEPEWLQVQS